MCFGQSFLSPAEQIENALNLSSLGATLLMSRVISAVASGACMTDDRERLYEQLLVLRCQTGDENAYRELVDRFGPRLYYYLRKSVVRPDRVDDLVQEVWLDAFRQLPRLKNANAFRTWLYRIAHGIAMLEARRNGRLPEITTEVESIAEDNEETFSPDDAVRIHAALDRLEPHHREALVLRFLEGLSYDQIGEIVGCPVGTVRSRIHYAKAALGRLLDREHE